MPSEQHRSSREAGGGWLKGGEGDVSVALGLVRGAEISRDLPRSAEIGLVRGAEISRDQPRSAEISRGEPRSAEISVSEVSRDQRQRGEPR